MKIWRLRYRFTARRSFVLFALLAFAATLAYMAWYHRNRAPVVIQEQRWRQVR